MKRLLVIAATVAAGCSGLIDRKAAESTYAVLEKSQIVAKRQSDLELARAAVPGGLLQLEAFALAYPSHAGFRTLHAEALCQYATAFVFDDWEEASLTKGGDIDRIAARVERLTGQCIDANLALLPAEWRADRARGEKAWLARVAGATAAQADALRWIATSEAVLLALAPLARFQTMAAIEATLSRVIALAPGAHDSDAELMLGTLQAGRSRFLGGPDGREWFERARTKLGAGALIVDVMYARAVLVTKQDRAEFTATLERVLAADTATWPDRRLANELAIVKARRYLAAIDTLVPR